MSTINWISVKDQLPKLEYHWVLASTVDQFNPNVRFIPVVLELINGKWASIEHKDYELTHHVKVTHWSELPESPTDE